MHQSTLVARREIAQNEVVSKITSLSARLGLTLSVDTAPYYHDPHRREIAFMEQLEQVAVALGEIDRHVGGLIESLQEAEAKAPVPKPAAPPPISPTGNTSSVAPEKQADPRPQAQAAGPQPQAKRK